MQVVVKTVKDVDVAVAVAVAPPPPISPINDSVALGPISRIISPHFESALWCCAL